VQGVIRRLGVCKAGHAARPDRLLFAVTADAVAFQHGIDLVREGEGAGRSQPGRERLAVARLGKAALWWQRGAAVFVAAGARDAFARHPHQPTAHKLHGVAVGIQRLQRNRRVGRDLEAGRAVRFDTSRAEHALHIPTGLRADQRKTALADVAEVVGEDTDRLDRAARHPAQPGTAVNVCNVYIGCLGREIHAVRNHRRPGTRQEELRLEKRRTLLFVNQGRVVEHVHQVDAPQTLLRGLHRHQKILAAKRMGMRGERRPLLTVHVPDDGVAHGAGYGLAPAGNQLHEPGLLGRQDVRRHRDGLAFDSPFFRRRAETERVGARQPRIENRHPATVAEIVMAADDAHDSRRVVGDRLGKTERRGKPGIAAVKRQLPRAVGIHGHPPPREVMRNIAVLPALEQDAAVVQHGRVGVAVLVERQLPQRLGRRVQQVQAGNLPVAVQARQSDVVARRAQHDASVRQVAGVEVVQVRVVARSQLHEAAAVAAHLEDGPTAVGVDAGKQHPIGGEVQPDVADDLIAGRLVQRVDPRLAAEVGQHGDVVVPAAARHRGLILVVVGHEASVGTGDGSRPRAAEVPTYDQQPVEIEQRVGQQCGADAGQDRLDRYARRVGAVGQCLQEFRPLALESGHGLPVCRRVVAAREFLFHVVDGQPHGFQVDVLQRRDFGLDLRPLSGAPHPLGPLLRRGPRQLPAVGKRHGRLQPQPADMWKRTLAAQHDRVRAAGDGQLALLFPLGRRRVPAARHALEPDVNLLVVQLDFDRAGLLGGVQSRQGVLGGDRKLDLVLRPIRQLARVPDAGRPVGVRLTGEAHPRVAAVEIPRLDGELRRGGTCREGPGGEQCVQKQYACESIAVQRSHEGSLPFSSS